MPRWIHLPIVMFTTFTETQFINLLETPIAVRFSENYAFLDGKRPLAQTGANNRWNRIGIGFIVLGLLTLPAIIGGLIYYSVSQGRPFAWDQRLILLLLPLGLYIAGRLARKDYIRRKYVAWAGTHVVPGVIKSITRAQKVRYITFEFSSPIDGKILRGQEPVGKLEPVLRVLRPKTTVGVLFADHKHYTML